MTVIKINAITVPEEAGDEVARRFAARAGAVDDSPGFLGFELLKPEDDRTTWLVVTRWEDEASFEAWRTSDSAANAHAHGGGGAHGGPHGGGAHGGGEAPQRPMGLTAELWSYSVAVVSEGKGSGV